MSDVGILSVVYRIVSYRDSEDSGNTPLCIHIYFHNSHVRNSNTRYRYVMLSS